LNILSKDHPEKTIKSWMKEDHQFIQGCIDHRKFIENCLNKYAHNPKLRTMYQEHLDMQNILIQNLKKEFYKDYGETYKLLSTAVT